MTAPSTARVPTRYSSAGVGHVALTMAIDVAVNNAQPFVGAGRASGIGVSGRAGSCGVEPGGGGSGGRPAPDAGDVLPVIRTWWLTWAPRSTFAAALTTYWNG